MGDFVAFNFTVALIVAWLQPAPSHKMGSLLEVLHVRPGLCDYSSSRAFLDTGDGLEPFILFRAMGIAQTGKGLLAFPDLTFYGADHFNILPYETDVRLVEVRSNGGGYHIFPVLVDSPAMDQFDKLLRFGDAIGDSHDTFSIAFALDS